MSAWGKWRSSLSAEENEKWLNPFYYIFGTGDADNDYTLTGSFLPFESNFFKSVFSDMLPDKSSGGNFGLYSDQPLPMSLSNHELTPERLELATPTPPSPLLLPDCSLPSLVFWSHYFFQYIPDYSSTISRERNRQQLHNRLVKDVRKLKENLNDLEIEHGENTSDLPGFIREIMKAREEEKRLRKLKREASREVAKRMSAFINISSEEEDGDKSLEGKFNSSFTGSNKASTLPARLDESFTKFAAEVNTGNGEVAKRLLSASGGSSTGGRSPVLKTKITVQKEEGSIGPMSPAARWVGGTSTLAPALHSPIMPSPPIPVHKKSSGIVEGMKEELTDL